MKEIYSKLRNIVSEKFGALTSVSVPKLIFVDESLRSSIEGKFPNIKNLISDDKDADTVLFIISNVPSPFVDSDGRMYLRELDFVDIMPCLLEFFSSQERNIPINEAFNILIARLTGERYG